MRSSQTGNGPGLWLGLGGLVAVLVFAADLATPLGFAHGTLYLLPIGLAGTSRRPVAVLWLAASAWR